MDRDWTVEHYGDLTILRTKEKEVTTDKPTPSLLPCPYISPRFGVGDIVTLSEECPYKFDYKGVALIICEVKFDQRRDKITYSTLPWPESNGEGMTTDWPEEDFTIHTRNKWNTRPSELRQAGVDGEHPLGQGYVDALADTETADKIDDVLRYAKNAPKGDLYRAEYNKGWNDCLYFVADKMNAQPAAQKTEGDMNAMIDDIVKKTSAGVNAAIETYLQSTGADPHNHALQIQNHGDKITYTVIPRTALASRASVDVEALKAELVGPIGIANTWENGVKHGWSSCIDWFAAKFPELVGGRE